MNIVYKPTFIRQYKKLSKALQEEVKEKIVLFQKDIHHSFLKTHKLQGKLKNFWSFSVNYSYRIVFAYEAEETIALLTIGDHDVYK